MSNEGISKTLSHPEIASELEAMATIDQDMRAKNLLDDSWNEEVDKRNTERLKRFIEEIGWPTISKVGESGAHNAWLLVQHADRDVAFQKKCLELMKEIPKSEVAQRDVAYLEDRVMANEKGTQMYGTQFRQRGGKHVPIPIKDLEHVNERRKEMGLGTLEEGIQGMYEQYGVPDIEDRELAIGELLKDLAQVEGMNAEDILSDIITFAQISEEDESAKAYLEEVAEKIGISIEEMMWYANKQEKESQA